MDDFLDQILSAPQWVDANGVNRPWGDASSVGAMSIDSIGGMESMPKLTATANTMALMHPELSGLVNRSPPQDDDEDDTGMRSHNHDNSHLSYQRMMQLNSSSLLRTGGFEGQGMPISPFPLLSPTWQQQYVGGGGVPPPPPLISDSIVKICHDEEAVSAVNLDPGHVIPPQGIQSGTSITSQTLSLHQSPGTDGAVNGPARPRVRARRGQATDPHSIAERNRRERIAERMKALQELVPDANKTDKASMLDEIIAYVRFLQMQVKCLSVCRLGGAATNPLSVDVPGEGAGGEFMLSALAQSNGGPGSSQNSSVAYAERQVERLMDEDMSVAMQYLQRKGLCLMPISLATAISSITATPQTDPLPQASAKTTDNIFGSDKETLGNTIASEIPSDIPTKQGGGGSIVSLKDVQRNLDTNTTKTSELSVGNNSARSTEKFE